MYGEFRVKLTSFDQATVTKIFTDAYQNKLPGAYARSAYKNGASVSEAEFCAGYHTNDSLLLCPEDQYTSGR